MSEETRVILPQLPVFGGSAPGTDGGGGETATITSIARVRHANKQIMTGLTSGAHARKLTTEEHVTGSGSSALKVTATDLHRSPESTGLPQLTGTHHHQPQEKSVCLPAIEVSEQPQRAGPPKEAAPPMILRSTTPSPLGGAVASMGAQLTPARDAAYIRSRSVTPSPLGAPRARDVLSRSKQTSHFAGYLPDLPQSQEESVLEGNLTLTVEGHHDLQLPPKRKSTESRKVEKSQHRLSAAATSYIGLSDGPNLDEHTSWEDNLKTLLLCHSMGVHLEVTQKHGRESERSIRPVFHCPRCLKHWVENGTTLQDCYESEQPTFGPIFEISKRSHDIIREFESLTHEEKCKIVDVIMSFESAVIGVEERGGLSAMVNVELKGRQTMEVGESVAIPKMDLDVSDTILTSTKSFTDKTPERTDDNENSSISRNLTPVPTTCSAETLTDPETQTEAKTPVNLQTQASTKTQVGPNAQIEAKVAEDLHTNCEVPCPEDDASNHLDETSIESQEVVITGARTTDVGVLPRDEDQSDATNDDTSLLHGDEEASHDRADTPSSTGTEYGTEEAGQYGPDGAYYPGYYAPDGRFIALCRITSDGERHPVVLGPDGRFYANARYSSDGRFHLGEAEPDKHGVMFLSASEMAALKASQSSRHGVVGPDGLFYPHGFYQSDGTFVAGGPPHSGHPEVWGPTRHKSSETTGYSYPPTQFGPAWPPDAPAPYAYNQNGQHPFPNDLIREQSFPDEGLRGDVTGDMGSSPALSVSPTPAELDRNGRNLNQVEQGTLCDEYVHIKDSDGMRGLHSATSSLDHGELARDLFSPWEKDEDLPNFPIAANIDIREEQQEGKARRVDSHASCEFDDLSQDVPLSNLDSRIDTGSDDEFGTPDGFFKSSQGGKPLSPVLGESSMQENQNQVEVDETASKSGIRSKKRRESNAAYMAISDQSDSTHSQRANARRGSVAAEVRRPKQGKNRAVKNVTGKPQTKPGMLQKHLMATPSATLAQTNLMGINNKRQVRDVRKLEGGPVTSVENASVASKDNIKARRTKLPAIGGGEPLQDDATRRSPSPIKQIRKSVGRIGSGEKRKVSNIDGALAPPVERVKTRSAKERRPQVKKKKAKENRKTVGKRLETDEKSKAEKLQTDKKEIEIEKVDEPEKASNVTEVANIPKVRSPIKTSIHDAAVGTYQDLFKGADETIKTVGSEERHSIAAHLSHSASILEKFSEFRVSGPAPPSPLPTEQAPSFRMTYSTLPNYGVAKEPQISAPKSTEHVPVRKPSKSKSIPFDFERVEKGYNVRARTSSTRSLLRKKSSSIKSARPVTKSNKNLRSGSVLSDTSSRPSSAESVRESISEIWKRHKEEMSNLEKCVADSYLPLTHAFTFSMFSLAPGYAAHNKVVWEKAAAIKQLRQPIPLKKTRRLKPVKKRSNAVENSLTVKGVIETSKSTTVAPVK